MTKKYLIIYETNYSEIFKKEYYYPSQKEAIKDFNEKNAKYCYRIIAIRDITSGEMYII